MDQWGVASYLRSMQYIAVFCGASAGHDPIYMSSARAVGRSIAQRGLGVVYGGGHVGLMGAVLMPRWKQEGRWWASSQGS